MRVAFVGSRPESWKDPEMVRRFVQGLVWNEWHEHNQAADLTYVSGGAAGIDTWSIETAETIRAKKGNIIQIKIFPAEWELYGKSAGFRRNELIVAAADKLIAVWDGNSKGTKHSIDLALGAKVRTEVYFPER